MKLFLALLTPLLLVSCAPPLEVSLFHLRGESSLDSSEPMITAEARFRYQRNIEAEDRKQKHGHYFTIRWKKQLERTPNEPVQVKLAYIQPDQGRTPRFLETAVTPDQPNQAEFSITGPEYLNSGRILAWRVELHQNGDLIGTEQSYLWE